MEGIDMKKITVAVIDDHPEMQDMNSEKIQQTLENLNLKNFQIKIAQIPADVTGNLIDEITNIISPGKQIGENLQVLSAVNGIDILFLDYQLPNLKKHPWLTAEDVAGALRIFGRVPVVCILNRFHDVDFDLSMVYPSPTAADLHINAEQLQCQNLWRKPEDRPSNKSFDLSDFRPWYWPALPELLEDIESCRRELMDYSLDTPVFQMLGFEDLEIQALTKTALGFINPQSPRPESASLRDFFEFGCNGGVTNEIKKWVLEKPESNDRKEVAVAVIVAELRRWLTHMVLASGDAISDIPHAVSRMYWLQKGDLSSPEIWDHAASFHDISTLHAEVQKFQFEKKHWLSRTAYWTQRLEASSVSDVLYSQTDSDLDQLAFPVYLEDFSVFVDRSEAEEFYSALNSIWANRFISRSGLRNSRIKYAPKVRLA